MTADPITPHRLGGPPTEMACATCGRILNTYRSPGGGVSHVHPAGPREYDHRPAPVPADQLTAVARDCDFCSNPYPILAIRSGLVHAVTIGEDTRTTHNFGDTWAACITCARLVDAGKEWAELHWMQPLDLPVSARCVSILAESRARSGIPHRRRNRRIDVALSATWNGQWIWLEQRT